jgi:hypothetical protein
MKEVADGCFQQLYGEIVRSMVRFSAGFTVQTAQDNLY